MAKRRRRRPLKAALRPARTLPQRTVRWAVSEIKTVVRKIRRRWSRSMRLRVVATTMLLGLLVVLVVGTFLSFRIQAGLIESRQESAMIEAERLTDKAIKLCEASDYTEADGQDTFVNGLIAQLEGPAGPEYRGVVLLRAMRSTEPSVLRPRSSQGVEVSAIPDSLRVAVNRESRQQAQITTLSPVGDRGPVPALAVGSIIDIPLSGDYELYFLFPLEREQQILELVQRTLLLGGIGLVLLVGGVAYVVTRQVVSPVRLAAKTAEELASGRLDRRMQVRGQDDIARLGRAFNGMAASLERQIHQLEELSRVQRRFVSDVSHELRTPLTTIRMASEVIHEGRHQLDPVLSRSAELLQNQLDRFESLLTDLLEISRFDAGAAVLDIEADDVREVVERVVEALQPLAESRGSVIELRMPVEPCLAQIDSRRVERIIRNLVGNAIEHGEGAPIEIRVAGSGEAVAIAVHDHGVGITVDDLAMVFNRFWRADLARARTIGGTGLGLAIAQEDAHLHGGWLQAWGEPGVGAVFRLTLPRQVGAVLVGSPLPLVPHLGDPEQTGDQIGSTIGPEVLDSTTGRDPLATETGPQQPMRQPG
jgi:two-component system sensor histidine kinase MtrB